MLASDILCIVFIAISAMLILTGVGITIDYFAKRRFPRWTMIAVAFVGLVIIGIFVGAIVSIVWVF